MLNPRSCVLPFTFELISLSQTKEFPKRLRKDTEQCDMERSDSTFSIKLHISVHTFDRLGLSGAAVVRVKRKDRKRLGGQIAPHMVVKSSMRPIGLQGSCNDVKVPTNPKQAAILKIL